MELIPWRTMQEYFAKYKQTFKELFALDECLHRKYKHVYMVFLRLSKCARFFVESCMCQKVRPALFLQRQG